MSNTKEIQPVQIWTSKGNKNATILSLTNFFDYHFDDGSGKVSYKLLGMETGETSIDENGNIITLPSSAIEYASGIAEIPSSIIQQWGSSDDIVWNYISITLNLIFIENK